jgi:hypothetical protein
MPRTDSPRMSRDPVYAAARTALLLVLLTPAVAWADVTAFLGIATSDGHRSARGVSLGLSLLVVGFEFEYANIAENEPKGAPSMKTTMFNGVVQSPGRTQVYASAGGGYYTQNYRDLSESGFGTNVGGGIKIGIAGPLRLRVDYRVFSQKGEPFQKTTQRWYFGANISF